MTESRHGIPTAAELLSALHEWLEQDVMTAEDSRLAFNARVARNVVAMLERELALGPQFAAAHTQRLARLGYTGDAELAEAVRSGVADAGDPDLIAALRATAIEKLRIANPRYLRQEDA